MLIAQITDLHIGFDRGNPHELNVRRLNLVMDELNERSPRPEMLLVTGDLVENGDDADAYQHMHALVGRWQGPKIWLVGNHDTRDNFKAELPDVPTDPNGFVQYELEHGGVRWIVLDTLDEGRHGGMICEKRAWWLAERLQEKQDNADGTQTLRFEQEDVHDFTWTASRRYEDLRARFAEPGYPEVEIRLLLQPEHHFLKDRYFEATRIALRSYGAWSAPYPYPQITVVDPAWSSGAGGMEYPTLFTGGAFIWAPRELQSAVPSC